MCSSEKAQIPLLARMAQPHRDERGCSGRTQQKPTPELPSCFQSRRAMQLVSQVLFPLPVEQQDGTGTIPDEKPSEPKPSPASPQRETTAGATGSQERTVPITR